jgi:hypothetical protein
MRWFGQESWAVLVILGSGIMALEDWEALLPDPGYARACPDYKKYSTFTQYSFIIPVSTNANTNIVDLIPKARWAYHTNAPPSTVEPSTPLS